MGRRATAKKGERKREREKKRPRLIQVERKRNMLALAGPAGVKRRWADALQGTENC